MSFLIALMSFANFVFYPLVIGTIIAVIIEQIFRARGDGDNPKDVRNVMLSMGIRKYLYRQAWIFNVIWFICLLYTSPSPRDGLLSRMPSSA